MLPFPWILCNHLQNAVATTYIFGLQLSTFLFYNKQNWLFSDTPDGATANALYLTIVEMAKAYHLNLYEYLKYLLEHRPSKEMSDDELAKLAPWSETIQEKCSNKHE